MGPVVISVIVTELGLYPREREIISRSLGKGFFMTNKEILDSFPRSTEG